jgi:hypothetical protein
MLFSLFAHHQAFFRSLFSRAANEIKSTWALQAAEKLRRPREVSGHDFSRAGSRSRRNWPLQAAEKGQMMNEKPEKRPSGAEAHEHFAASTARLKSCPDASSPLRSLFRSL